jgi:CheY-like chemotaxis protein
MIIDDEESVTRMVKLNLEKTGHYSVRGENQAVESLSAAREFQPELILLDVMMPGMDGGDVASRIKADPRLKDVPILFLTAIVSKSEAGTNGLSSGGGRFIAKPVKLDDLIQVIEETLQRPAGAWANRA